MQRTAKMVRGRHWKERLQWFTMALPAIVLRALFAYLPMFGIVLAFKQYKVSDGIFGSKWIGFKNFEFFIKSQDAWRVTRNTLGLNFLFIFTGTACAVIFAFMMYEVKKAMHIKIYQTVSILPKFLSWVAVSYITYALLDPTKGIINRVIESFGGEGVAWYSRTAAPYWPVILMIVHIWHSMGMSSILYFAALMGVDNELFEAAEIDGAGKLQKTIYISLPSVVPIIVITTILNVGSIFRADFGLFYNVTNDIGALYSTTDVIDTYVYRALMTLGDIGMGSAVGIVQSVVCTITIVTTNAVVKKISPENTLF